MQLLFLTPQLPYPPHKGTTIRNFNLIAHLARRHDIDLLSFADGDAARGIGDSPLGQACRRVETMAAPTRSMARRAWTTGWSRWPDMALRLWSSGFADRLAGRLRAARYDVVQIEGIEMARYALRARRVAPGARWVFDDHNAEWLLQQRAFEAERDTSGWSPAAIYSRIQAIKLRRFERRVCRSVDRVVAVSQADAAAIRALDPALRVDVVANGVDTHWYQPDAVAPLDFGAPTLVFTGTMDFRPNVDAVLWFAERVLPRVRASIPSIVFAIVGQRPHHRLDALRGRVDIHISGAVADVRPFLAGASAIVVPLRMGSGTRLKVLESMAMGAPIVSTSLGVEGFDVADDREVILADEDALFAARIIELLGDEARRRRLGAAARRYVEAACDWGAIVPNLDAVYA